ncbi:MAG: hypothetical protein LBG79_08790 [Spirochaetaceae bacterium]|jgi:hypothetical protein|nr:hypothetical protein [Spirochaetaceae bacterium]
MSRFIVNLIASIKALAVLVIPPVMFMLFAFVIHPRSYDLYVNNVWLDWSKRLIFFTMILAIIVNLLWLLIIPAALGGYDAKKKCAQFWAGFIINTTFAILCTGYVCFGWAVWVDPPGGWEFVRVDRITIAIVFGIQAAMFLGAFILGSRLVSPAYKHSFWFKVK